MNLKSIAIMVVSVAFIGAALAQTQSGSSPSAAAEIKARSDAFAAAWNKHDPKAMAAIWATDGDLIDPFGATAKGRADVEKFFTIEHTNAGRMTGTTYVILSQASRMVNDNVAIADWDVSLTGMKDAQGSTAGDLKHHVTLVLSKDNGQWMVDAARPVIYATPPAKAPSQRIH